MRSKKRLVLIFLAIILIPLLAYLSLAIPYWSASPRLTRNIAAELNAGIEALPESQRAWPAYRSALKKMREWPEEDNAPDNPWTGDLASTAAHWNFVEPFIHGLKEPLAEARQASKITRLGYALSNAPPLEDMKLENPDAQPSEVQNPSDNPMTMSVLLLPVSHAKTLALLWCTEALVAAQDGDHLLVCEDIKATLALSRHLLQLNCAVGDLAAANVFVQACTRLNEVAWTWPKLLTADQLVELQKAISEHAGGRFHVNVENERLMFVDILQRTYTDNGHGDGYWAPYAASQMNGDVFGPASLIDKILGPITARLVATRRETTEVLDDLMARCAETYSQPLWMVDHWWLGDAIKKLEAQRHHRLVALLFPALDGVFVKFELANQQRDATLVALALIRFHRRHDHWPESLEQLVPDFLPGVPLDRMDGQTLRYTMKEDEPVLYSIGPDRTDDDGDSAFHHPDDIETDWITTGISRGGDWLLWPPTSFAPASR